MSDFLAYRKKAERLKKLEAVYEAAKTLIACYRLKQDLLDCMIKLLETVNSVDPSPITPDEAS